MTKRDWIWFAIRVTGLYLLVQAILAIPLLLSAATGAYALWDLPPGPDGDHTRHALMTTMSSQLAGSFARLVICGLLGINLVRGGTWLFEMIYPPDTDSTGREV